MRYVIRDTITLARTWHVEADTEEQARERFEKRETHEDADCVDEMETDYAITEVFADPEDWPRCSECGDGCNPQTAHNWQGKVIGDECCWDDRLKASE